MLPMPQILPDSTARAPIYEEGCLNSLCAPYKMHGNARNSPSGLQYKGGPLYLPGTYSLHLYNLGTALKKLACGRYFSKEEQDLSMPVF